jgi:peptidyl-prolyl cis-trans isomerase D
MDVVRGRAETILLFAADATLFLSLFKKMVNTLRRFGQPIMITVTVLVIITFAWWGPSRYDRTGKTRAVLELRGKPVSAEQWQRQGRLMQVHAQLGGEYASAMDPGARFGRISPAGVENSLLFDGEADALGVSVTQEELEQELGKLPAFMGPDGKLDASRYEAFVQRVLNPEGFNRSDIDSILRDEVKVRKIGALLASTMPPTPEEIRAAFLRERLTTEASYVAIAAAEFRAAQKVTEEELKARYEARKDFLKSPEMRKVRFAAFTLPPTPDGKPLEESKKVEALQALAEKAYDLATALQKPGVNFDEAAKQAGATVGETAQFFSQDAGPAELEGASAAATAAFALSAEKPYSPHLALQNGTYVLAFKETKPPEQLPLDGVRKQLEEELIAEKADTAMRAKAAEFRTQLIEARKGAKSFAEAAQRLGLKSEAFPAFSMMQPVPPTAPHAKLVQSAAGKLAPGEISEVIVAPGTALIIHVDQRPIVDEKGMEEARARIAEGIMSSREAMAFQAWLADRRETAGLKAPKEL